MDIERTKDYLDHAEKAAGWLRSLGVEDGSRGHANLSSLATLGIPLDLLANMFAVLEEELPQSADPDMALNNLERFISAARSPLAMGALFERDRSALPTLLQILSTSQYLSDLLVRDNESYEIVRVTGGAPVTREDLVGEIVAEIDALPDDVEVMRTLRRFKHREILRIVYGDVVAGQKLETVTGQLSHLAEAIVEGALRAATRKVAQRRGMPHGPHGEPARLSMLALGKLGGSELNYSSDIDLIAFFDVDGRTDGQRSTTNQEFFERVIREMVRLLTEPTELGSAYRVDLRLRPQGSQGPLAPSLDAMHRYYENLGRTWERQAFVKARPVAGDLELGQTFLARLQPWIYRRYLSLADITGIKSLKRRIEAHAHRTGVNQRNVKTGHGGIRDIEFAIQFLQLLNGGTLPEVRTGNTLEAIIRLERSGCLSYQERMLLEENYRFLRQIEHRLQILFDLQTHEIPEEKREVRKLAIRLGFDDTHGDALESFETAYAEKTGLNRKILDHLLHDAFGDDAQTEPEVDLINEPDPPPERIEAVLGTYPFRDKQAAYHNLMALATEPIRFLSTRRCRHFLAAIAPRLLRAIAATPDPDATLVDLSQVSDSLGGKGVLWELFSSNQPSMDLYVRLCAACPYISGILTSNPGMIDELMDSLLLEKLPSLEARQAAIAELLHGAEDIERILHSFKDAQQLRVGVRDILGRDDVQATHAALADIAEVCLQQIANCEYPRLVGKFGEPTIATDPEDPHPRAGAPCELVILALGKLGGREPNYHSDLDIVFLYEADGATAHHARSRRNTTTNQHFFSELGQRIIKTATHLGPYGRLYEIDPRLRPTGRSGALAVPLAELHRYFAEGQAQLWERLALCKARVVYGSPRVAQQTMQTVHEVAFGPPWQREHAQEIRSMRMRMQESASDRNLKRGAGGTVDIEFVVQMLQLKYGGTMPAVRKPGTLETLDALHDVGVLAGEDHQHFADAYRHLRTVESRIRLMNSAGRHELPTEGIELEKLAYLLGESDPAALIEKTTAICVENRRRFERFIAQASH